MFNAHMKPIRTETVWLRFERGRFGHALKREIYSEGPMGISFTHGVGRCGEKGEISHRRMTKKCGRCELLLAEAPHSSVDDASQPSTVRCPECGADPGVECATPKDRPRPFHRARLIEAQRETRARHELERRKEAKR